MRINWIDNLRGIAILAVVLGHMMDIFPQYKNIPVFYMLSFTIPWFVYLSGYTNILSLQKLHHLPFLKLNLSLLSRRIMNIYPVYFLAALFASLIVSNFDNSPRQFIRDYFQFMHQPTFYFVLLITELYFVFPLLAFVVYHKKNTILAISILVVVFYLSFFVSKIINPAPYSGLSIILWSLLLLVAYQLSSNILFGYDEIDRLVSSIKPVALLFMILIICRNRLVAKFK